MANKGSQGPQGATDSMARLGCYPLGSTLSRAAARALLETRKTSSEEFRVQCYSVLDGKPVGLDGLAERIRAARMEDQAGGWPVLPPTGEDDHDASREGERIV